MSVKDFDLERFGVTVESHGDVFCILLNALLLEAYYVGCEYGHFEPVSDETIKALCIATDMKWEEIKELIK